MLRRIKFFLVFLLAAACVERYEFVIKDNSAALVVEGYISDRSFDDTRSYPSDGRYFSVKLSLTGDVTNVRPVPVSDAVVELESTSGERWVYRQVTEGLYELHDDTFKAQPGMGYRLTITDKNDESYQSAWEMLPQVSAPAIGDVGFRETEIQMYTMEAREWVLRSFLGVQAYINVSENATETPLYYRWTFSPMWGFKAALSSVIAPGHICWATDVNYLNRYQLQTDLTGGYARDLFFIRTVRNERIYEKFSVLVVQQSLTKDFYEFWREMQARNEGSTLMDTPPYNLETNFFPIGHSKRVMGYFGVAGEQAKRWYFSKGDLSYTVTNTLQEDCLVNYGGPPAPECFDCTQYSFGIATTRKPLWRGN